MKGTHSDTNQKKSKLPLYLSILLISGLVICYFAVPSVNQFLKEAWVILSSDDESRIKTWIEGFGWLGPFVIMIAMVAQMFLLVIPTILLMIVAVLSYGPIWGTAISLISIIFASTVGYLIGSKLGTTVITRLLGQNNFRKVSSFLERYGFWAVAITRINPFLSNDAISFVTGILKMDYWKFISATLLGIFPLLVLLAIIGKNTDSLKSGLLWGSAACFVAFLGYFIWDKKINKSFRK